MPGQLLALAAWFFALKFSDENGRFGPAMLGAMAGAVFALVTWVEVFASAGSIPRAALATPLYVGAGALFVGWFRRVDGILAGLMIVALGTAALFFGVPGVVDALLPATLPAAG